MAINKGILNARRTIESDEQMTPKYAVKPILKYLKQGATIWCPFDEGSSQFLKVFRENGFKVITSHINQKRDFFKWCPDNKVDYIISNPPYSCKDKVIERLYELDIPFAMLMPIATLQGKKRFESFKNGIQLLAFDKRINYIDPKTNLEQKGNYFASGYFCKDILPKDLILEELIKEEVNE